VSTIKVDTYLTRGGASEIAIDKLKGASSAGSMTVVGEGGSTTTNLQQGLAKNWVHSVIGSGTPAVTDSFNTASITDESAGNYSPQFTSNMANATFAVSMIPQYTSTSGTGCFFHQSPPANNSTSDYNVQHFQNGDLAEASAFMSTIHGDLA
jgi:hypothetical protein